MFDEARINHILGNAWREPTPVGDAILAVLEPEPQWDGAPGRKLSPGARLFPRVAAALDKAQITPTTIPDEDVLEHLGINYERSNFPDREVQQYGKAKVKPASAEDRGFFAAAVEAAITGPVGLRTVVVHDESAFKWCPPWPEDSDAALVAWPVPAGYSSARVGRAVLPLARVCRWCQRWFPGGVADAVAVTSGAVTHLFPACVGCRRDLDQEVGANGGEGCRLLDYITNDGWDAATGYPADRWR